MKQDIERVLISEKEIADKVRELGERLTEDYRDKNPLLICILKGSTIFFADLVRHIGTHVELDFMATSSYGNGSSSSGEVRVTKDLERSVEGREVIIVEDIIDSGLTLNYLKHMLERRNAKSVKIVTLLDKPARRKVEIVGDYTGFEIDNYFVVGYGLDYAEKYRNLPYVGILKPEVYGE